MKVCKKCGRILDDSMFNLVRKGSTALRSECKDCVREYQREYQKRKKAETSEKQISKLITNNAVDDIFCLTKLKDIPSSIRKDIKMPKILLRETPNHIIIKSNIRNVLRRTQKPVHLSQIQVAYYRMYKEFIKTRPLSIYLYNMKKNDSNILNPSKGYYAYRKEI